MTGTRRADRPTVPGRAQFMSRDRHSREPGPTRSPKGTGARGGQDARMPKQRDCGKAACSAESSHECTRVGRAYSRRHPFSRESPPRGGGGSEPWIDPGIRGRTRSREWTCRDPVNRPDPGAEMPSVQDEQVAAPSTPAMGVAAAPASADAPQTGERRDRSRPRGRSRGETRGHQPARTHGGRQSGARQKSGPAGNESRAAPGAAVGTSRGEG